MTLAPKPGFDWTAVSWGGPDELAADQCSYCEAEIDEDEVPLILWNQDGWCARFCERCMQEWWGLAPSAKEEDDGSDAQEC